MKAFVAELTFKTIEEAEITDRGLYPSESWKVLKSYALSFRSDDDEEIRRLLLWLIISAAITARDLTVEELLGEDATA